MRQFVKGSMVPCPTCAGRRELRAIQATDAGEIRDFYCPMCDALARCLVSKHGASELQT